jgi:zinc protease
MQYYKSRYVPNNLTFIVAGDVDAKKFINSSPIFSKIIPRNRLRPVLCPGRTAHSWVVANVHNEFATELSRLALAWHIPEITHPDVPAIDLLAGILGDGRSSRLYRRCARTKRLAFSVSAFSYTPGDPGLFGIGCDC